MNYDARITLNVYVGNIMILRRRRRIQINIPFGAGPGAATGPLSASVSEGILD